MSTLTQKLSSRKFWMAIAAFLASIGGTCAGFATGNDAVMVAGIICTALSTAIYAASEAYVDAANASSTTTAVTTNISATTTAKDTVEKMLTANTATEDNSTSKTE